MNTGLVGGIITEIQSIYEPGMKYVNEIRDERVVQDEDGDPGAPEPPDQGRPAADAQGAEQQ